MTAKIKPLEWEQQNGDYHIAECPIGNFIITAGIQEQEGKFVAHHQVGADNSNGEDMELVGTCQTLEAAKTACQTHFENIVKACLEG